MSAAPVANRAAQLRSAFDRAFAEPPPERAAERVALLGLRVAGAPYGVRLAEVGGLFEGRRLLPVPSSAEALLGLAGIRGAVVPVFDLRRLLGHPPPRDLPRWILVARAAVAGFAFDEFDAHLLVAPADLVRASAGPHVRELARGEGGTRPLVSLTSVLEALR